MRMTANMSTSSENSNFSKNVEYSEKWIEFLVNLGQAHGNTGINQYKRDLSSCAVFIQSLVASAKLEISNLNKSLLNKSLPINSQSYAQVTAKSDEIKRKAEYVCIIEPEDGNNQLVDSNQTLSCLKGAVTSKRIAERGLKMVKTIPIRNKKVLVKCEAKTDCLALETEIKNARCGIKVKIPKKKNPTFQVLGVESDVNDEQIIDLIVKQNCDVKSCLEQDGQFLKKVYSKNDRVGTKFMVFEASPLVWQKCTSIGHLFIGYKCCIVKNYLSVIQCLQCLRHGHPMKYCRNKPVCSKCGGEHLSRSCSVSGSSQSQSCFNCVFRNSKNPRNVVSVNHSVFDKNCHEYKIAFERVNNNIDYGY